MKKTITLAVLVLFLLSICAGCGKIAEPRSAQEIVEEMVMEYGSKGDEADKHIEDLLKELDSVDKDASVRWEKIMELWKSSGSDFPVNYDIPPEGLPDTDELCFVVLGFCLAPDGSMRDELIESLKVALSCASVYPNARIVCTGGATATEDKTATEAGRMADWLIENGVAPERIIVEDKSLSTVQNAIYTFDILKTRFPQIKELVIISGDYQIATGTLLFGAEAVLREEQAGNETVKVIGNASWKAPSWTITTMLQAKFLIELSNDTAKALEIYYEPNSTNS